MKELRRPCARCPFRSDIEPYIHYMRAVEIAGHLQLGNMFPCHETTQHDDDGEYTPSSGEKMCAGAAITLLKYDGPNHIMRIFDRIEQGSYLSDLEKNMEEAPLYEDLEDWIAAHDPDSWQRRHWERKHEREKQREEEAREEEGSRA